MTESSPEPEISSAVRPSNDAVLRELRASLEEAYGPRLARVLLFGSRARSDAGKDSDYDVAVFLRGMPDRRAEFDRLNAIATDILYEHFVVVNALPFDESSLIDNPSTLMRNIREEGVEL